MAEACSCPICWQPARKLDWRPNADWVAIAECPCQGFFVEGAVLEWRLPRLTHTEREELAATIQGFRAMGREAWLTTAEEGGSGRLLILTERPNRSIQP